jgi:uncharacterized protein (UPF0332 family)
MSPSPLEQLVLARLQQAKDSLKEAETLNQAGLSRGAINRAYYAMFYIILALAVLRQKTTSKHSGVIAFFDREFVKPGIFPRELSKSLHLLFQKRQENDYGNVFLVNEEEARLALVGAQTFVQTVEVYIKSELKSLSDE